MKLLTQNEDLKKSGVFGWTIPAHWAVLSNGEKFNACPNAGICAAFCYAKSGRWNFSNVKKSHREKLELVLNEPEKFFGLINEELKHKKYKNGFIRIHDAGDFFNVDYAMLWLNIAKQNTAITFYTYTKEVAMFNALKLVNAIPQNFIIIYSFGGKQDKLINRDTDRHSDVFPSYEEMELLGYVDIGEDDKQAAINPNHKIGLIRNNISHLIKKMGDIKFSDWQQGKKPTHQIVLNMKN